MIDTKMLPRVWIIAAGDNDRQYADICLDFGVVLMGPSYTGPLNSSYIMRNEKGQIVGDASVEKAAQELLRDGWSSRKVSNLKKFSNDPIKGDWVILKVGKSELHGVGIYAGHYEWHEAFADVDGWNLGHVQRVKWIWNKPEGQPKYFGKALGWGDTTQEFKRSPKTEPVFEWLESLKPNLVSLPALPEAGDLLTWSDTVQKLFDYGIASQSISSLIENLEDLGRLASWYGQIKTDPSEQETIAHLVCPLLRSLGWTAQTIQLQLSMKKAGRADLALYPNGNRDEYKPIVLVEVKKLNQSCLAAEAQIRRYADEQKYVRRLVLTDGIRYALFIRHDGETEFPKNPSAYLNIAQPRSSYPIYGDCLGAGDALLFLSPLWSHRFRHPNMVDKED